MAHEPGHRESTGAKRWLEENVSKKQIQPWLEHLTGVYPAQGKKPIGLDVAMNIPLAGGIMRGGKALSKLGKAGKSMYSKWKGGKAVASTVSKEAVESTGKQLFKGMKGFREKLFADPRIAQGTGKITSLNQQFAASMKQASWKNIGTVKSPVGGMGRLNVSVADKLVNYGGRDMTAVMFRGKKGSILQPFYRSTGLGEPTIKSGGKFLPFEGILPKKLSAGWGSGESVLIGGHKVGNAPGWMIKGFKQPGATRGKAIFSSTQNVGMKEGLPIHQETGTMLQKYFK